MKQKPLWRSASVYQIYPRSFQDSNGDGVGDIPGIISRLDYLKDLGVEILWLSPVYQSPLDDMGYDVADYMSILPEYGTMEDMDRLIEEAKKRNIRIVMDLVVNHTSDEHKWFIESKKKDSPYHDYYYWREGKKNNTLPPNNWTSMFTGPAWTFDKEAGLWYLHIYGEKQPDLNWHNPKVLEEVEKIITFWLDKGIYGFRCDVINQIYKESLEDGKGHAASARGIEHYLMKEGNHQILRKLYDDIFSKRDAVMIGETFNVDYENGRRFLDEHELDMFFQFDHMGVDKSYNPLVPPRFKPKKFMEIIYGWQENCAWNANYLENHDQRRSITRFGDPKKYWKESGKMLATLNLTLHGTPFIYQGEEIGMLDLPRPETYEEYKDVCCTRIFHVAKGYKIFSKRFIEKFINQLNRDHARTPMQWDDSPNAGFSSTQGQTWLPVNPNFKEINAKKEAEDPDSILAYYKKLLRLRKEEEALIDGTFESIKTKHPVYQYFRKLDGQCLLIVLNFSGKEASLEKDFAGRKGKVLLSNVGRTDFEFVNKLKPFEAAIIKL